MSANGAGFTVHCSMNENLPDSNVMPKISLYGFGFSYDILSIGYLLLSANLFITASVTKHRLSAEPQPVCMINNEQVFEPVKSAESVSDMDMLSAYDNIPIAAGVDAGNGEKTDGKLE